MAQYIGGEVATSGTTHTTILSAPGASIRRELISVKVNNRDVITQTITLQHAKGATNTIFHVVTLAAGEIASVPGAVVLDATDETIEVFMGQAANTTEPICVVAAFEEP